MNYTVEQIKDIVAEAQTAAFAAATKFFQDKLGGVDQYACGFAATRIYGIKGNTKLGRTLKAAGINRNDYEKCFEIWNPSKFPCQNVDTLEAGARAAAEVFSRYGFDARYWSRLD